jgi:L-asparaginase/beta-aspartyl-peptidase (threonine type)
VSVLFGAVVHGGAGSSSEFSDGCENACQAAFGLLKEGKTALDAAVEAVRILEDDGRFNAGRGSVLRLDGKTVEMDAAVMDSADALGVVMAIRHVKNPVLVAREVISTPHVALAGPGAGAFAKRRGFKPFHQVSSSALERHERLKQLIKEGRLGEEDPRWRGYDVQSLWNSGAASYEDIFSSDTVGAVALDRQGNMAVATSTGGASPMMVGRVGDTPMIGCGFYAGSACAVAVTGIGEEIMKRMPAKTVYDMVLDGEDIKSACAKGIAMFPAEIAAGIIGISTTGHAVASNREMANYVMVEED